MTRLVQQKLSPMMRLAVARAQKHDGYLTRHPGGFWCGKGEHAAYRGSSFGTSTVTALVTRGVMEWSQWKDGRNGRFPIEAKLVVRGPQS